MCLIDPIGRRNTLKTLFGMFAISIFLMFGCSISKSYLLLMLFIARGTMAGVFQVVYLYTPEVYPTNLRAVAYGKLDMYQIQVVYIIYFSKNIMCFI